VSDLSVGSVDPTYALEKEEEMNLNEQVEQNKKREPLRLACLVFSICLTAGGMMGLGVSIMLSHSYSALALVVGLSGLIAGAVLIGAGLVSLVRNPGSEIDKSMSIPSIVASLYHRCPAWTMLLLLGPLLFYVAAVAKYPFLAIVTGSFPRHVLSGKLFAEPFDRVHAGMALDQPTIGKWLLWFSFLAALSVPIILLTRWLSNLSTRAGRWTFAIPVLAIVVFLLSILVCVLSDLVQYVYWMGFTPKRVFGLSFGLGALILLPWFLRWTLRRTAGGRHGQTEG
jgi:hypothetical protein